MSDATPADDEPRFGISDEIMQHTARFRRRTESNAYLSAPSGKFITGETLVVDGGHQIWGELRMAGRPDYFSPHD